MESTLHGADKKQQEERRRTLASFDAEAASAVQEPLRQASSSNALDLTESQVNLLGGLEVNSPDLSPTPLLRAKSRS